MPELIIQPVRYDGTNWNDCEEHEAEQWHVIAEHGEMDYETLADCQTRADAESTAACIRGEN